MYFMMLHGWIGLFGDGLFSIRSMSALPGVASVMLGMWLVRLIANPRAALLAGLMLALFAYGGALQPGSADVFVAGIVVARPLPSLVYWVKQPRNTHALVIYALLMATAFYTHYFTCTLCARPWAYLLVLRLQPEQPLKHITRPAWWLSNVAIVVLFAPWIPGLVDRPGTWVSSRPMAMWVGNCGHAQFPAVDGVGLS